MTYAESRFRKPVEDMDAGEVQSAIDSMEDDERYAREHGHGISSKETVTHRDLIERRADLFIAEKFRTDDPQEIARLKAMARKMMEPA